MNEKGVLALIDRDILKAALKKRNMTQVMLSERLGMKGSALSQNMSRQKMSLGMFTKILSAMDYDVVIRDRTTGEIVFQLDLGVDVGDDDI